MTTIRSIYNSGPLCDGITFSEPTATQQQFKDECNVNFILRRYADTGVLTHVSDVEPCFDDCSEFDYLHAMNTVVRAQEDFNALPSAVRKRFNNSPQELFSFLAKEENRDEAVALGLVVPKVSESASDSVPAPAPAPAPASDGGSNS